MKPSKPFNPSSWSALLQSVFSDAGPHREALHVATKLGPEMDHAFPWAAASAFWLSSSSEPPRAPIPVIVDRRPRMRVLDVGPANQRFLETLRARCEIADYVTR